MANYSFYPQKRLGHILGTADFQVVLADIGGALLRHALEDPDNLGGIPGLPSLPSGHRISVIQSEGLYPATHVMSGLEPFALSDGSTITISVAGEAGQTVTFNSSEFANIAAATRDEVLSVILAAGLVGASARAVRNLLCIHAQDELNDSIQVTGGTAVTALGLDTNLHRPFPADDVEGYDWTTLSTQYDDHVFPVIVSDPDFTSTNPCPSLTTWSTVLG